MSLSESADQATPKEAINPAFYWLAGLVLRFRWPLLLATLAITTVAAWQVRTRLRVDNSVRAFVSSKSRSNQVLEELRADFGRDDLFLILVGGDVFSMPYLDKLKALHKEIEFLEIGPSPNAEEEAEDEAADGSPATETDADDMDEAFGDEFAAGHGVDAWAGEKGGSVVDEIISLVNVRETSFVDGALRVGDLLDPWPGGADLPALRAKVLADKTKVGQVVGAAGKHSAVVIRTRFMSEEESDRVYRRLCAISERHRGEGFEVKVAGPPALGAAINSLMIEDLRVTALVAVIAMLAMLFYLFRHPLGVIGPVGVVIQASVWTFGMMATVDVPMTMLSNILPAFLVCVGVGDSVHIQSVYRDKRRAGTDNDEAIRYAVATTGIPVLFTTLTTMVGLLSFRAATLDAISDMGTLGALGVLVALLHSVVFLPIVLSFNRGSFIGARAEHHKTDWLDRLLGWCTGFSRDGAAQGAKGLSLRATPRRLRAWAVMAAVLLLSLGGGSLLRLYHNPLTWIPPRFEVRQAFDEMDAHIGGTANIALLVDTGVAGGAKNVELLRALEKLEARIHAYDSPDLDFDLVGNSLSLLDAVKESNRALHDGDAAWYRLPDSDRALSELLFMFESAGPAQLKRMVTNDMRKLRMDIRVRWVDAPSYGPFTSYVEDAAKELVGDLAEVRATGSAYSLFSIISSLISDLIRSFGLAFVVISLMMIAMLRSLRLGVLAMVPNLLPIVAIMGLMGATGVPIDLVNLLIASIAIGIAVDDTIHYLHHFKSHYALNGDVERAIAYSVQHSGRAITVTSVILCVGFLVYTTADMYNLQRFGALISATVMFALLINIVFAPALLRTFYGDRAETRSDPKGGLR